jgi:hypothetical protein
VLRQCCRSALTPQSAKVGVLRKLAEPAQLPGNPPKLLLSSRRSRTLLVSTDSLHTLQVSPSEGNAFPCKLTSPMHSPAERVLSPLAAVSRRSISLCGGRDADGDRHCRRCCVLIINLALLHDAAPRPAACRYSTAWMPPATGSLSRVPDRALFPVKGKFRRPSGPFDPWAMIAPPALHQWAHVRVNFETHARVPFDS